MLARFKNVQTEPSNTDKQMTDRGHREAAQVHVDDEFRPWGGFLLLQRRGVLVCAPRRAFVDLRWLAASCESGLGPGCGSRALLEVVLDSTTGSTAGVVMLLRPGTCDLARATTEWRTRVGDVVLDLDKSRTLNSLSSTEP